MRNDPTEDPWVHRYGSTGSAGWAVNVGTPDSTVRAPGWTHTGLRVADLTAGATIQLDPQQEERIIIPLSGSFDAVVEEDTFTLAGRRSVFHGPSDVLYTGVRTAVRISSIEGGRVAVASAPAEASYPVRHVSKDDVPVELRGAGVASRQVHNFGTPAALEADRFIVCEVLTPAGNWSSYPPHKHDEEKDGETALEEIYYFEMQAEAGAPVPSAQDGGPDVMGYQRVYASDDRPIDVTAEVRSGDVVLVPYGWHGPAMTPPGHDMYYLNVMAGPGPVRQWLISDDPHHGWIRQTWDDQDIDPRLPFSS
ncbi:5-deoxy-glucuronate isomerase [Nesterenkonia natronophila]|uniref:5-deoxy-glucuronate isomerase n=1 Tax=Nesterenkonia natronophila TaxID=2174932 RepID=A0A3A4F4A7_9MICC|nr:5-deoxy-glucuronate isomerase [Nesterenkonia natronophila]RJN33182.1 5-deoxy-glucuronate isomerase [Nesterenkonia natronophila]